MGELTYDQLIERMARGKLGGSYFLKTEDTFLRDEAIRQLTQAHLDGGSRDFDLDQLNGDEADAADLASRLEMPPMLSRHRVVVIKSAQGLSTRARSVVENALNTPLETRVLVVSAEVPRGSKAKFYSALAKGCTVVNLRAPRPSEVPGWLAERARAVHGAELEIKAAELLASGIGARLGPLAQELDKLVTYVEPRKKIEADDVRAAVSGLPQVDRWGWIDTVMERRFQKAIDELPALLDSGDSAVGLVASLSEALIRVGLARGGAKALEGVLKRDGSYGHLRWKIGIYTQQARGWSEEAIDHGLGEFLRADRLIKSGGLPDRAALLEALLRLAVQASNGGGHASM